MEGGAAFPPSSLFRCIPILLWRGVAFTCWVVLPSSPFFWVVVAVAFPTLGGAVLPPPSGGVAYLLLLWVAVLPPLSTLVGGGAFTPLPCAWCCFPSFGSGASVLPFWGGGALPPPLFCVVLPSLLPWEWCDVCRSTGLGH